MSLHGANDAIYMRWNQSRCEISACTAKQPGAPSKSMDPGCPDAAHKRTGVLVQQLRDALKELHQALVDNEDRHSIPVTLANLEGPYVSVDLSPGPPTARVFQMAVQGPARPTVAIAALTSFLHRVDGLNRLTPDHVRYIAYFKLWFGKWQRSRDRQFDLLAAYEQGWADVAPTLRGYIDHPGRGTPERAAHKQAMAKQVSLEDALRGVSADSLATFDEFL